MSHSMRARIGYCGSNSLSPEPCVLIPSYFSIASYFPARDEWMGGAPRLGGER